jgi:hypothetical protein
MMEETRKNILVDLDACPLSLFVMEGFAGQCLAERFMSRRFPDEAPCPNEHKHDPCESMSKPGRHDAACALETVPINQPGSKGRNKSIKRVEWKGRLAG